MGIQTQRTSNAAVILKSAGAAAALTLLASAGTAVAIEQEWMDFGKTGYASMIILLSSGFLCGRAGKGGHLPLAAASAAVYLGILVLVNLLFFGGKLQKIGVTVLFLSLGTALSMLKPGKNRKGRSKYKIPGL